MKAMISTLVTGALLAIPWPAAAQSSDAMTMPCKVEEVATYPNRVHVRCQSNIYLRYFASPTSSPSEAERLVTLGAAALTSGAMLDVTYNPFEYWDAYGCLQQDCRRPVLIRLRR